MKLSGRYAMASVRISLKKSACNCGKRMML